MLNAHIIMFVASSTICTQPGDAKDAWSFFKLLDMDGGAATVKGTVQPTRVCVCVCFSFLNRSHAALSDT